MTCHTKRRYDSLADARRVIDKARDASKRGRTYRQERRYYLCRFCQGYHVTSEPFNAPEHGGAA